MNFSEYIIPCFLFLIIAVGIIKRQNVFDSFTKGAAESLMTGVKIFPNILAVMCACAMLKASGGIDILTGIAKPVFDFFNIPSELSVLAFLRPVSGSGSIAVLSDILKRYGADSHTAKMASVIMASTETSIYTAAVYFSVTKVKHTRHTLICALAADFFCVVFACAVCRIYFCG